MSIRSRIATFEARNEEVLKSSPARFEAKYQPDDQHQQQHPEQPRMTNNSGSVAGRFGSVTNTSTLTMSDRSEDISQEHHPQMQRYQPLHQQYHQRQQQQRARLKQSNQTTEGDPSNSARIKKVPHISPHRKAAHYQRRLEQMRRNEDKQRRLHEESQQRPVEAPAAQNDPPAHKSSRMSTAQRLARMQRMKQARLRPSSDYEQRSSPEAVPPDNLSLQPSADEITLTSVRQIVGTAADKQSDRYAPTPDEMTYTHDDYDWPEEKSNKEDVVRRATTESAQRHQPHHHPSVPTINSQLTPDITSFYEEGRFVPPTSHADVAHDELSQGSESFAQRKERERLEEEARAAAVERAKAEMEGPFIKAEDMDYYQKSVDTPMVKTAAGVAVAATLGCIVLGPMGLLVGAAAVGIGVGVMQIPAEQRQILEEKATHTLRQVSETAIQTSESLSNTCVNTYKESGLAEHVPEEVHKCCISINEAPTTADKSEMSAAVSLAGEADAKDILDTQGGPDAERANNVEEGPKKPPPKRAGAACLRPGKSPCRIIEQQ